MANTIKSGKSTGKKHLMIVESPHKAQTIGKFLGSGFKVTSSMGHIRDLPKKGLGIDLDKGFALTYELAPNKTKVVNLLKSAAKDADAIYLASDPDREGEAIAWHLRELLDDGAGDKPFYRVKYNEITPRAVKAAIEQPGEIDMHLVDAQQARRAIDRIVGYKISPFVKRNVGGSSAGRVQSVALRLVCEREDEISAFKPVPYWVAGAILKKDPFKPFFAKLVRINGEKAEIADEATAGRIYREMTDRRFVVESVNMREISRQALPPFITISLQRAASSVLGMTPSRTMSIAQKLYEGVDIGSVEGPVGLITYMRTDGTFVAREAQEAARGFIATNYGASYVPENPNNYRSGASAQEAHEAIRPTDVTRTPASLAKWLDPAELKLYDLVWRRFVASQMQGAKFSQRTVLFDGRRPDGSAPAAGEDSLTLSASTTDVVFDGFMKVMALDIRKALAGPDGKDSENEPEEDENISAEIPVLDRGERMETVEVKSDRKETKPPARFSEASLIDTLEKNGIGRPSTYATIMETIIKHGYVNRERKTLQPTQLGQDVVKFLVAKFPALFEVGFTAKLEDSLDKVADGDSKTDYLSLMTDFFGKFTEWLEESKDPPADAGAVRRLLDALGEVKEWLPPEKRGRRVFDDRRLAKSIKRQFEEGVKPISSNQLKALAGIAKRHRMQIADFATRFADIGIDDTSKAKNPETPKETYTKLEILLSSTGLSERRRTFLNSIMDQLKRGNNLSPRQIDTVDGIFAASIDSVEGGREKAATLGVNLDAITTAGDSGECARIVAALSRVTQWNPPTENRGRTYDDKQFFESVKRQFETKGILSPKQQSALSRLEKRYADQIARNSEPAPGR